MKFERGPEKTFAFNARSLVWKSLIMQVYYSEHRQQGTLVSLNFANVSTCPQYSKSLPSTLQQ